MSLEPSQLPSFQLPEEERIITRGRGTEMRALLSSLLIQTQQLDYYSSQLDQWKRRHKADLEQLVRLNTAAIEVLAREEERVREAAARLDAEERELRAKLQVVEMFSEEGSAGTPPQDPAFPDPPLHHLPDPGLVNASAKVRKANKMALDAIRRDETGVLSSLGDPALTSNTRSTAAKPDFAIVPRSLKTNHTLQLQPFSLSNMTLGVREAVEAGRVFAVQLKMIESSGRLRMRSGKIQLVRGSVHLHCLMKRPPPLGSITIYHDEILNQLIDRSATLVFLEIAGPSSETSGRVYIRLSPDTGRGRQFTWLCTGQRGISYKNTAFLAVRDQGKPRERLMGGDYEGKGGEGGAALIPWLGKGKLYRREWEAGLVRGWWGGKARGAQFFITTRQGNPGETMHFAFGQVEAGLQVVRAIAALDDPSKAMVVDCGVVVAEEIETELG